MDSDLPYHLDTFKRFIEGHIYNHVKSTGDAVFILNMVIDALFVKPKLDFVDLDFLARRVPVPEQGSAVITTTENSQATTTEGEGANDMDTKGDVMAGVEAKLIKALAEFSRQLAATDAAKLGSSTKETGTQETEKEGEMAGVEKRLIEALKEFNQQEAAESKASTQSEQPKSEDAATQTHKTTDNGVADGTATPMSTPVTKEKKTPVKKTPIKKSKARKAADTAVGADVPETPTGSGKKEKKAAAKPRAKKRKSTETDLASPAGVALMNPIGEANGMTDGATKADKPPKAKKQKSEGETKPKAKRVKKDKEANTEVKDADPKVGEADGKAKKSDEIKDAGKTGLDVAEAQAGSAKKAGATAEDQVNATAATDLSNLYDGAADQVGNPNEKSEEGVSVEERGRLQTLAEAALNFMDAST